MYKNYQIKTSIVVVPFGIIVAPLQLLLVRIGKENCNYTQRVEPISDTNYDSSD